MFDNHAHSECGFRDEWLKERCCAAQTNTTTWRAVIKSSSIYDLCAQPTLQIEFGVWCKSFCMFMCARRCSALDKQGERGRWICRTCR